MLNEQPSGQLAVPGAEFEDARIGDVGHLLEDQAGIAIVLPNIEPTRFRVAITPALTDGSTSSRSRYSGRSVCNKRSRQDASGPPRGISVSESPDTESAEPMYTSMVGGRLPAQFPPPLTRADAEEHRGRLRRFH